MDTIQSDEMLKKIKCTGAEDYYAMYRAGYYVNSDEEHGFFWDRKDCRYVIKITSETLGKADRLQKECLLPCSYSFCNHSGALLDLLEQFKPQGWFTPLVRSIYETLLCAQLAFTVEAVYEERVVGGLFGIALGNVLTIDTLVGRPDSKPHRSTSKATLCQLIFLGYKQGITLIDGEVQHAKNHPAARLGESVMNFAAFREYLFQHSDTRNAFVTSNWRTIWH